MVDVSSDSRKKASLLSGANLIRMATLLAITGAIAIALLVGLQQLQLAFTESWRVDLQSTPDEEVVDKLLEIAQSERVGIPLLVESLSDRRESVVRGAHLVLLKTMATWRDIDTRQSSPKVAELAHRLALDIHKMPPESQHVATDLATEIMFWPLDQDRVDTVNVLNDCEHILRSAATPLQADAFVSQEKKLGDAGQEANELSDFSNRLDTQASLQSANSRPSRLTSFGKEGTGAESEPGTSEGLSPIPQGVSIGTSDEGEPEHPLAPQIYLPPIHALAPDDEPGPTLRPVPVATPDAASPNRSATPLETTPNGSSSVVDPKIALIPLGREPQAMYDTAPLLEPDLSQLTHLEVMSRLHQQNPTLAWQARDELVRRGFSASDIEMGRDVTHPLASVRKRVAEEMPTRAGTQSEAWLRILAKDVSAEVRRAALAILSTSQNVETRRFVATRLELESDRSVIDAIKR